MKDTQQRFQELIQWYGYHKKNSASADLRQQVKLLTDMNDNLFTLMTMMWRDMRIELAARKHTPNQIVIPANMAETIPFRRKFQ